MTRFERTSIISSWIRRAAAFARLFEAVHEGVYIGTIGPERRPRRSPPIPT